MGGPSSAAGPAQCKHEHGFCNGDHGHAHPPRVSQYIQDDEMDGQLYNAEMSGHASGMR